MKKVYIICFIFALGLGAFLFSSHMIGKYYDDYEFHTEYISNQQDNSNLIVNQKTSDKVSNITKVYMEYYYKDEDTFTEERIDVPVWMLEMSRDELVAYLVEYTKNPGSQDKAKGLVAYELLSFSGDKVVLRKTYETPQLPEIYYGYVENGYITIYLEDKETVYDYTNIKLKVLPYDLQQQMITGKKFNGLLELYEFLETYSS